MRKFKYSEGDVVGNLKIKGLGVIGRKTMALLQILWINAKR